MKAEGPFAGPFPPMRGRYLLQSPRLVRALDLLNHALSILPKRRAPPPPRLDRILLANWGHLGDVITTFGVIAALRARYPGIVIGMIVGSQGRAALERAGLVDHLHIFDHPILDRSERAKFDKLKTYLRSRRRALRDIAGIGYQAAIDLNPYFPPAHPLFYAAAIPVRIGYDSAGFDALLTHPRHWPNADRPIADHHRTLLQALDPAWTPPSLQPRRCRKALAPLPAELGRYILLHPGAGAPFKDWGLPRWSDLAQKLAHTRRLVVTGAGPQEVQAADDLQRACPALINLAGQLSWETFVAVVAHADLVICPDTATGHVAALFDVPTISLFTGVNNPAQWAPYSDKAHVLTRKVACAPCYRPAGCAAMACLRGIGGDQIIDAVGSVLLAAPELGARSLSSD